jgi:lysozyme
MQVLQLFKERKMKITKISNKGIDLIKSFEGYYANAYLCPANVPTIGWGTIRYPNGQKVKMGDKCTIEQATAYLINDLKGFESSVDAMCVDSLTQSQFDALVSFTYNLGAGNLKSSTLLKKVNINPLDTTIKAEFLKWNKAGGKVLAGLTRRREAEANLYFS